MLPVLLTSAYGFIRPMEYNIEGMVARDINDGQSQKVIRFQAFVKNSGSKHLCYAYSEKVMPIQASVSRAQLLMRAGVYSHLHGWRALDFYETETLFTKLSVKHHLQSVDDEKQKEMEITTSVS